MEDRKPQASTEASLRQGCFASGTYGACSQFGSFFISSYLHLQAQFKLKIIKKKITLLSFLASCLKLKFSQPVPGTLPNASLVSHWPAKYQPGLFLALTHRFGSASVSWFPPGLSETFCYPQRSVLFPLTLCSYFQTPFHVTVSTDHLKSPSSCHRLYFTPLDLPKLRKHSAKLNAELHLAAGKRKTHQQAPATVY